MEPAVIVAIFVSLFSTFFFMFLSAWNWEATQDKARARRMAEHRMNARLLRFNI